MDIESQARTETQEHAAASQPTAAQPSLSDPIIAELRLAEPRLAESNVAEASAAEPSVTESSVPHFSIAEPSDAESSRAELSRAEPTVGEPSAAEPEIITFDSSGDLFLEVKEILPSEESPKTYLLRVSTKVLSTVSRQFGAAFDRMREEYQDFSELVPATLQLPDDNATGIIWLCKAAYHQLNADQLGDLSLSAILQMALAAHKYECIKAFAPAIKLLQAVAYADTSNPIKFYYAMAVDYIIGDSVAFYTDTRVIVRSELNPIDYLPAHPEIDTCPLLSPKIWLLLTDRIQKVRDEIARELRRAAIPEITGDTVMQWPRTCEKVGQFPNIFELIAHCEMAQKPMRLLLEGLRVDLNDKYRSSWETDDQTPASHRQVATILEPILNGDRFTMVTGLCLTCIKTNEYHPRYMCRGIGCDQIEVCACRGCDGQHDDDDPEDGDYEDESDVDDSSNGTDYDVDIHIRGSAAIMGLDVDVDANAAAAVAAADYVNYRR